jgi:hypothetical protein
MRARVPQARLGRGAIRSGVVACVLALAGVGDVGPVQAQVSRSDNPEADQLVARGIELRAQGKDGEALEAFQKAAEIDPESVRVQIHLATVYQALGDWLLADDYLTLALSRQNHPYVVRHRQVLEDAKRVIEQNIGRLEVEGEPLGAEVRLNGRLVGTLPLARPVRMTVGSYQLEVRRQGFYPMRRPIALTGGGLVRESIRLEPAPAEAAASSGESGAAGGSARAGGSLEDTPPRPWLTWTLAGAAGVAGAVTVGAVIYREDHAENWNDNAQCLEVNRTRAEVCGDELDKVDTAETVAVVSGVLTGLFAAGAVLNALGVFGPSSPPAETGLSGCNVGIAGASCFGKF